MFKEKKKKKVRKSPKKPTVTAVISHEASHEIEVEDPHISIPKSPKFAGITLEQAAKAKIETNLKNPSCDGSVAGTSKNIVAVWEGPEISILSGDEGNISCYSEDEDSGTEYCPTESGSHRDDLEKTTPVTVNVEDTAPISENGDEAGSKPLKKAVWANCGCSLCGWE